MPRVQEALCGKLAKVEARSDGRNVSFEQIASLPPPHTPIAAATSEGASGNASFSQADASLRRGLQLLEIPGGEGERPWALAAQDFSPCAFCLGAAFQAENSSPPLAASKVCAFVL